MDVIERIKQAYNALEQGFYQYRTRQMRAKLDQNYQKLIDRTRQQVLQLTHEQLVELLWQKYQADPMMLEMNGSVLATLLTSESLLITPRQRPKAIKKFRTKSLFLRFSIAFALAKEYPDLFGLAPDKLLAKTDHSVFPDELNQKLSAYFASKGQDYQQMRVKRVSGGIKHLKI